MSSNMKFVTMTICLAVCSSVHAQTAPPPAPAKPLSTSLGLVVFPAKGQTPQKQSQDEGECFAWSKGQTGSIRWRRQLRQLRHRHRRPPHRHQGGQRARGAARGAAAGAIIGEVADDDAGKGAAIGATAGALKGGAEKRRAAGSKPSKKPRRSRNRPRSNRRAATQEQLNLFKKGFAACLEPKGYTVK